MTEQLEDRQLDALNVQYRENKRSVESGLEQVAILDRQFTHYLDGMADGIQQIEKHAEDKIDSHASYDVLTRANEASKDRIRLIRQQLQAKAEENDNEYRQNRRRLEERRNEKAREKTKEGDHFVR